MKQEDIDRIVEIVRVEKPDVKHQKHAIRKRDQDLDHEFGELQKKAIAKLQKELIKVWETSNGVLVEARAREKTVTILDKESYTEPEGAKETE